MRMGTSNTMNKFISPKPQQGAIMIITLIGLSLLMLSALALIRSFDTSLSMAGNLSFKRDLVNQGERGMAKAIALFNVGALSTTAARENDSLANNYSAIMLNADSHGIPLALINSVSFSGLNINSVNKTFTGADVSDAAKGITLRYVIDRLCKNAGPASSTDTCVGFNQTLSPGGTILLAEKKVGQEFQPVYRISVRATGPRNTQVYLQTTITR
jgi:type IV pilus assembly protein PilX